MESNNYLWKKKTEYKTLQYCILIHICIYTYKLNSETFKCKLQVKTKNDLSFVWFKPRYFFYLNFFPNKTICN